MGILEANKLIGFFMLFITIVVLFLLFCTFCHRLDQSILHPIRLFFLFISFLVIVSMVYWRNDYNWSFFGVLYILVACVALVAGCSFVGKRRLYTKQISVTNVHYWIYYIFISIGFLSFVQQLYNAGLSLSSIASFKSLLETNSKIAYARYNGGENVSILGQICLTFTYVSSICGGYVFNFSYTKKKRFLSICGILPSIFTMMVTNAKAGFIAAVILWYIGFIISYIKIHGKLPVISFSSFLRLSLIFIVAVCILYLAMLMRVGDFSSSMRKHILEKFMVYGFASILNFDYWVSLHAISLPYDLGKNTYMVLFRLLGISERVQGVYQEFNGSFGNVYTAFRGVMMDFGWLGGIFLYFIHGSIIQICINNLKQGGTCTISCGLLAASCFFLFFGFFVSPWVYTSFTLCIVLFMVFVYCFTYGIKNA